MRSKLIIAFGLLAAVLFVRNLHVMFNHPDDSDQGPIYRILFFHVPSWFVGGFACVAAVISSVLYLARKDFFYDGLAVAATECAVAFFVIGLVTGSIWGRITWGIWWTWDARLTSALVLALLYTAYLVLRTAIEDPSTRARLSAVVSIFAFADVPLVWFSIELFRTQHPAPVLRGSGYIDPAMKAALYSNVIPLALLAAVFILIRLRQETQRREIDALRREAHALA